MGEDQVNQESSRCRQVPEIVLTVNLASTAAGYRTTAIDPVEPEIPLRFSDIPESRRVLGNLRADSRWAVR